MKLTEGGRDFDENPYSPDEERVAKWLSDKTGIGGGDDPIGFLMASHEYVVEQRDQFAEQAALRDERDVDMQIIMNINNKLKAEVERLRQELSNLRKN